MAGNEGPEGVEGLPKRALGSSGLELSEVGLGAWVMGGSGWAYSWGPQDDQASIAAIERAVSEGVNWIDTAAVYGYGHSEEVVRRALRAMAPSQGPLVFTKTGLRWYQDDRRREPQRNLSPESIRQEVEASLRRLGVERIDLYQLHWPDQTGVPVEESWGEMGRLIDEGKIHLAGVSNFDVSLLERCEAMRHVESLQPPLSLINREAAGQVLEWARSHQTGVIVYSPLHSGLLAGAFTAERVKALGREDWRRYNSDYLEPNLSRNLALVDGLRPVARRHGATIAQIAVSWVLSWPGVTGAIVGARNASQVGDWIQAPSRRLTPADLEEIASVIERTGAGWGPLKPVST